MKLHVYKEALFYLHSISNERNPDYARAFINCVIAAGGERTRDTVIMYRKMLAATIHDSEANEEEVPQSFYELYEFLNRREVYVDIELSYLDEAEKLCKKMLEENKNMDFAVAELAYIQKLREAGVKSIAPVRSELEMHG